MKEGKGKEIVLLDEVHLPLVDDKLCLGLLIDSHLMNGSTAKNYFQE